MKNKIWKYMKGDAFKERQGSFTFFCQKSLDLITDFVTECRAGWFELFHPKTEAINFKQLNLAFNAPGWFKRNWQ